MEDQKTILVVDDTPENIDVLVGILKQFYKVKAAPSGEKALKSAGKKPPDLILLDIMMPEMDGYQVLEQLKTDPVTVNIPVVFVTGMSDNADQEKGMAMGAKGYLTKPVDPQKVLELAQKILS
ncbi:MAG: response regulator [Deltaproteobacteria bacterium]|jgi:CheY-like chemotaxis protein|nr:response regulator [Deltaproteobacteria bacterium]MBT4090002.1 response regulator [Deltaproteobacteria bacterium]MBT4265373.1 response regulator [Deltaproteobacteria bacterium]MBT4644369.1 response regulator [Deltaproteobacteria bacterium]MBT6501137.1 response regulator [Deltaproteobacteria bacterium]